MIQKIKIDFKISGTKIFIPFNAICSITNKKFEGLVISEYSPKNETLEYVSLEKFIDNTTKNKLTAEELANKVFTEIKKTLNLEYLKVTIDVKKSEAHQPVEVWVESKK